MKNSSIWNGIPMQTRIACMVSYAAVFKDVINLSTMFNRLNIDNRDAFDIAVKELESKKNIVVKDGFAALPHLADKILHKQEDILRTERMIRSKIGFLKRLGKLPLIKFIGISGSLAAGNPVESNVSKVDIDIFVITRNQLLWFFEIPLIIIKLFHGKNGAHTLCFNYVIDESDLLIYNRNFYTANEIRNLIPVSGLEAYKKFLQINNWVDFYFPGFINDPEDLSPHLSKDYLNRAMFLIYTSFRCIKNLSINPLRETSFQKNSVNHLNINRVGSYYGGYQAMVLKNFTKIFNTSFPDLKDDNLIDRLFGDELSNNIKKADYDIDGIHKKAGFLPNKEKYEQS